MQEFHQTRPNSHGDTHYNALAKQGMITITTQLTFVFREAEKTQSSSLSLLAFSWTKYRKFQTKFPPKIVIIKKPKQRKNANVVSFCSFYKYFNN